MKKLFTPRNILVNLMLVLFAATTFAQTITTGTVTPGAVCAGSTVSVAFATTGTFPTSTTYTVELSDDAGDFTSPTAIGSGTSTPITATIPAAAAAGTAYKIRITSATPAVTGTESAAVTISALPPAPTVANVNYTVGDTPVALTATGTALQWYDVATGGTALAAAPVPTATAAGTQSYWVTQTVGGCESPRALITVTVACAPPAAPTVANVNYTVGDTPVALTATGTALKWYDVATGGTALAAAPVPTTTAAGTQSYWVTQTVGGCESPRALITVTVAACTPPAAPTVANVNYTVGDTPVALTATGTALKWYDVATGGTALAAAPVPTTTAAGTQSYWVTQTVGGCESPRALITVTVAACTPPAAPTVANVNYTVGDTPVALTATGTALKWYDVATGGTALAAAPVPTATAAGTQSYWVTQTVGGCESPRALITVTVAACTPPAAPTVANVNYTVGDTPVALTATGTALKWYDVATGGTALAAAPVPTTTAAGTQSYWVTQTVGSCESPRALITVTVSACVPPAAPTVANVSYTVGDTPAALTATGTALKWYTTATGGTGVTTAPTPTTTAAGTQSFWVTQTVGSCESPRALITVTVSACVPPAAPTVANVNYTVGDTPAALTATGTALKWYTTATGGAGVATAPTPTTTAAGTQSFWVTQTVGSCESARALITVTVSACVPPAAPTVANISYTVGDTPAALTATGTALKWYTTATGGAGVTTAPTPTTTAAGTQSFWVTQTVGSCESPRALITVTVSACVPPAAPTVANVSYTVGDTPAALTATGTALKWYTTATGGAGVTTAPTPSTTAAGTQSFWVTQTVGSCESARALITVTVSACAVLAPTVANITYCKGATATALTATGTALKWYTTATGGTGTATAPVPSTAVVGTKSYYVTQTVGPCESPRAKIDVVVIETAVPVISTPAPYCLNETATALTATGTALKWYSTATATTSSTTAPVPTTTVAGVKSYFVTQTVNGCESEKAEIIVTTKALSVLPTTTMPTVTLCQNSTAAALTASGTALKWYSTATATTALASAPVPPTTTVGTTSYYVSQTTTNACESPRLKIDVVIKDTPLAPTVTPQIEYCVGTTATALTPSGAAYSWYPTATATTPLSSTPVPSTTTAGTTNYYVSQNTTYPVGTTNLVCEGPRSLVSVVINPTPTAATVIGEEFCQEKADKTYSFAATPTTGNTIAWYTAATGGTALTATPTVNLKAPGDVTYYAVQVSAKNCESATRVAKTITVKPLPALPVLPQPSLVYCQFDKAVALQATPQTGATLDWFGTVATGGTASPTAPVPSTETGGTTSYYVGQTLNGCAGDRTKIDVQVNTTPKPATTTSLAYCQGETAPILDATGYALKWYRTVDGEWQGYPFTPFTEKVEDYSFYVTQTGQVNGCESPKEEIKIHIKAFPSATISGNSTIKFGETASVKLAFTSDGPWSYTLSDGTTGTSTTSTTQVPVQPAVTTTYSVTEVSNACGKGIQLGVAIVNVLVPTITTGNPSVAEACAGGDFQILFQKSGDFPTDSKMVVQLSTSTWDSTFYSIPSLVTGSSIVATIPDSTQGGTYYVRVASENPNPEFTQPGTISEITLKINPIPTATITGNQTIVIGDKAQLNVALTGIGPWQFYVNNGSTDSLYTATTTPYSIEVAPAKTTTYAITTVSNGCGTGLGKGTARVQVDPILGVEPPVTEWVKVYPTLIEQKCLIEITNTIVGEGATIQLLDTRGVVLKKKTTREAFSELDFSAMSSGIYLIRIENGDLNQVQRVFKP
ncbi:putative secreted protein (Por secretion system target) [Dyadobacter jejuensis]|uniref:Putative secreted protein (Por secretion system target) n=1 Tax=Dyadobacter jejuensis TaxID=1082580 RepID=A0A316ACW2_9BACT|nr:T9SS type A sorting domain-containing protein [Dyadobacter jejuensis]PWJ54724.1 putative secreted protein (Por secretion system target) [Dyadobacter jejuensis]